MSPPQNKDAQPAKQSDQKASPVNAKVLCFALSLDHIIQLAVKKESLSQGIIDKGYYVLALIGCGVSDYVEICEGGIHVTVEGSGDVSLAINRSMS